MGALDEIVSRAECLVSEGKRDMYEIVQEAYDLEYCDWFLWELLKACYNPSELVTAEVEAAFIDYITAEVGGDIQELIDLTVQEEEDEEEAVNAYYDLGLDELDDTVVMNREREVFENLGSVISTVENGHELYQFFHKDGCHSVTWDETQRRFIA